MSKGTRLRSSGYTRTRKLVKEALKRYYWCHSEWVWCSQFTCRRCNSSSNCWSAWSYFQVPQLMECNGQVYIWKTLFFPWTPLHQNVTCILLASVYSKFCKYWFLSLAGCYVNSSLDMLVNNLQCFCFFFLLLVAVLSAFIAMITEWFLTVWCASELHGV